MSADLDAARCRDLWCAVLLLALTDASGLGTPAGRAASEREASRDLEQRKAEAWLGSKRFHQVCALAGVDGAAVLERWRAGRVRLDDKRRGAVPEPDRGERRRRRYDRLLGAAEAGRAA